MTMETSSIPIECETMRQYNDCEQDDEFDDIYLTNNQEIDMAYLYAYCCERIPEYKKWFIGMNINNT